MTSLIAHQKKWKIKATSYLRFSIVFVVNLKLVGFSANMLGELEGRTSLLKETAVLLKPCMKKIINF